MRCYLEALVLPAKLTSFSDNMLARRIDVSIGNCLKPCSDLFVVSLIKTEKHLLKKERDEVYDEGLDLGRSTEAIITVGHR
jgi:hypothetical protein